MLGKFAAMYSLLLDSVRGILFCGRLRLPVFIPSGCALPGAIRRGNRCLLHEGKENRGEKRHRLRRPEQLREPEAVFWLCQSGAEHNPEPGRFCYSDPAPTRPGMRPRILVFITLLTLCHLRVDGQTLTNMAPEQPAAIDASADTIGALPHSDSSLPDDPGQEIMPIAEPEPAPATGVPVEWTADRQVWAGDILTLTGSVTFHYRDYVLRADKVTYNRATTELKADGHLQVAGGPNDVLINATSGEMRLDAHTARFYNVTGSQGVRTAGHTVVYSTTNPLIFTARVAIENGEGDYRLVDGSITNCRLPHPDWRIIARTIALENRRASTSNSIFEFLGIPIFYLPYLRHAVAEGDRESGLLIPVVSNGSSIRGYTVGEQVYWAINRSMDMVLGSEYFSRRGWAPNGDFRYKGPGLDHLIARGNALLDRGIEETTSTGTQLVNQGGVDVVAEGRKNFSPYTRIGGTAEYLSSYVYRLVFNDNYSQATSSQVSSDVAATREHNGFVPSVALDRFETFAGTTNGDEVRILHLPNLRFEILDRPLGDSRAYWGLDSSLAYLSRSEPDFHARNVGRADFFPHLTLPFAAGGWSFTAEGALRDTAYSISQIPDLTPHTGDIPTISHDPLNRVAGEASFDLRPPALERDFDLPWHRELRHVIEPEITYRYVGGIGPQARNVLLFDTTDIVTNTDEVDYSLTQRFYMRQRDAQSCSASAGSDAGSESESEDSSGCPAAPRQWASWQIAEQAFLDPYFGGAVIKGRRNVFESTLRESAITFLTGPRNLSPIVSRARFEAIDNMRIEWDFEYDPKRSRMNADNLFAGYGFGHTTAGLGYALINAPDEISNSANRTLTSQIVTPFVEFGKPTRAGFDIAVNGGYDFAEHIVQYAGVQAVYNWDCCGLTLGYRRFELGSVGTTSRDETQWLYSFTLANFGNVGDIRRSNSIFRDPTLPPIY
jgi:LPS-assembly protein